jgi:hypothetical protein
MAKTHSLEDYSQIEHFEENGLIRFKGNRFGFMLVVEPADASFFESADWAAFEDFVRPLILLREGEEIQICFSKRCDLENIVEKKLLEADLAQTPFSRKLILKEINELVKRIGLEEPHLFSTKIVITYSSDQYRSRTKGTSEIEQKRIFLQRLFEQRGMSVQLLNENQTHEVMARFASGIYYVSGENLLEEWPAVTIEPRQVCVNDSIFRALVLKELPEQFSEMGMIRCLTDLALPFDLSVRLTGLDRESTKKRLDRKKRIFYGMAQQRASGDAESRLKYEEIEHLLERLNDSQDALVDMTFTIGVRYSSQNSALGRDVLSEIFQLQSRMGHLRFEETSLNTFDCFLELIPGFKGKVFHQQKVLGSNAIHFLPLFGREAGDDRPVLTFETRHGEIFSFDPFHYHLANYNWLISGTSGSGKSFFVNSVLLKSAHLDPRVFIIDIGGSYTKTAQFFDGQCISLNVHEGFKMGPFFIDRCQDSKDESRRREHIQMVFWELLRDEGRLPSIEARGVLKEILNPYFEMDVLPIHPISAIRDDLKHRQGSLAKRLSLLLDRWCYPSFFGQFLDTNAHLSLQNRVVMFDLKGLNDFEDLSRVTQLILCSSVWNHLREDSSRPSLVVLDEVAFSLLKWQPDFVDELVSTVRKYNAGVIVVAQDLEKITSNSAGASILQNTQIKAILQQRGDQKNYAEPLRLTQRELDIIDSLDRRKAVFSDIFLMIDDRRAVIRFSPNLLEYYLGTSVPQENQALESQLTKYSGSFSEKIYQFVEAYGR